MAHFTLYSLRPFILLLLAWVISFHIDLAHGKRERTLPATAAILRMAKANGTSSEMCLMSFYNPKKRLPTYPDKSKMAPIVDLLPWDACFFVNLDKLTSKTAENEPYQRLTSGEDHFEDDFVDYYEEDGNSHFKKWFQVAEWFAEQAKTAMGSFHLKYFAGFPGAKRVPGSIVIVDDSNMCSAEKKIFNLMRGGARGVILYSASGALPKLSRGTSATIPVLAVGPTRYRELKNYLPSKRAVAYLPRKEFDPSMLVLIGLATLAFAIGGVMSGNKTLRALNDSLSPPEQPAVPTQQSNWLPFKFGRDTTQPPPETLQAVLPAIERPQHGPRGATSFVDTSRGITFGTVTKMVFMMALFLMMLYTFHEYFHVVDIFMYFVVAPQQLVAFFDPWLAIAIPDSSIRVPALSAMALSVTYHWVQHRYDPGAWMFQNVLGVIMAINGLNELRFPSMAMISWALALLFVYDVFFVFVTPYMTADGISVMEKVAAASNRPTIDGIDAAMRAPTWPNVLVVPGYYNPMEVCKIHSFVLLGVGDIFWPGLVSSYCYAFDKLSGARFHPYFLTSLLAYLVGLFMSMGASYWMESGQPALLYIVPALLVPLNIIAGFRRELPAFWAGSLSQR